MWFRYTYTSGESKKEGNKHHRDNGTFCSKKGNTEGGGFWGVGQVLVLDLIDSGQG